MYPGNEDRMRLKRKETLCTVPGRDSPNRTNVSLARRGQEETIPARMADVSPVPSCMASPLELCHVKRGLVRC